MNKHLSVYKYLFLFVIALFMVVTPLIGAIPAEERAALIAFYNATNGDNWRINSSWKGVNNESDGFSEIGTESAWFGVTVSNNHVTGLELSRNGLSGNLPTELQNLTHLRTLNLNSNYSLSGFIPPELGNLSNLEELNLASASLNGSIPSELGNLGSLQVLRLGHNYNLGGAIPSELGNLENLNTLYLARCSLSGKIPPELANASNLDYLSLSNNDLIGSIPKELGNMNLLKTLDMGDNRLSGNIPSELGNLVLLETLDLEDNRLTGNIPSELGNLSQLKGLNLEDNGLTGSIPVNLTNLSNLYYLYIGYNGLYTDNSALRAFLDKKNRSWERTQTIPPTNVSAVGVSSSVIRVRWTKIAFNDSSGGYKVYYSTTSGGPWTYSGMTSGKRKSFYDIGALSLGKTYYFTVKSHTEKYDFNNDLTITSAYSNQASGTTTTSSPIIALDRTSMNFAYIKGSYSPPDEYFNISPATGSINWKARENSSWMYLSPSTGLDSGRVRVDVYPYGVSAGTYTGIITVSATYASNSPTVTVNLKVYEKGKTSEPFGELSTPVNGSGVSGSIAVTGWALDDIGIKDVKIYRKDGGSLAYIGKALLVEGARPDVENAYPDYPNNYKAGWGYMLLTNFLPNGGNGTFTLHAIATDKEGNEVTLGTKTIICDNANAVKPFGAIDTPDQGGSAYGENFINWGWVLTAQPNMIPTNGSTINVFVDGVNLGHPTYNLYRSDIASLFPGYANSNGAVGYFYIDTTAFTNGVHTIQWTAKDGAGNSDGIGSRYFTIYNSGSSRSSSQGHRTSGQRYKVPEFLPGSHLETIAVNHNESIRIRKGLSDNVKPNELTPDGSGLFRIKIKELERLVIQLSQQSEVIAGYLEEGDLLRPLPIGSTLDRKNREFLWQSGPGFVGHYRLVFIENSVSGGTQKKTILVTIE